MIRVLAHAHTTWSHDGSLSFHDWRTIAREVSCDVVLLSEHEESGWASERYSEYVRVCKKESSGSVLFVPGIEFSQQGFHIICYGLKEWPSRPSSIEQLASVIHAQGCFLCLAHPAKYRWKYPANILNAVDAVEVWNSKWIYDGALGPHPRTLGLAKDKLVLAGQDVHKLKHLSKLFLLTESTSVLNDLRGGRYVFEMEGQKSDAAEIRGISWRGPAQWLRTPILRLALKVFKHARRLWKTLKRGRPGDVLRDNVSVP